MPAKTDYHDFVFKDGKLVGEFEEMYKQSSETPWHQDEAAFKLWSDIDLCIISRLEAALVCDIGCGLGHFSSRVHKALNGRGKNVAVHGLDISRTAVDSANASFPEVRFHQADLLQPTTPDVGATFDCILIREVLWYVCQDLDTFLTNVAALAQENAYVLVSQSFPDAKKWHGQDIFGSPEDIVDVFSKHMKVLYSCEEKTREYNFCSQFHLLGTLDNG